MNNSTDESKRPTTKRPTLKDVGRLANVDASLVSKLLNNDPNVSASTATRERVLVAVQELHYKPNLRARGLRLSRTWMIGAVFPDLRNPVYVPIFEGARAQAAKHGYGLILGTADGPPGSGQEAFERLLHDRHVDGLLIASGLVGDEQLRQLASNVEPVLVVNRYVKGVSSSVLVDDQAGCELAAEHLCSLGHKKLGVISGAQSTRGDNESSERRVSAFSKRAVELGGNVTAAYADDWSSSAGLRAASGLLAQRPDITAIFATTVMLALGVLRGSHKLGLLIPQQLSVISLHDTEAAEFTEPPLTTVALPLEALGEIAVERLLQKIEGIEVGHEVVSDEPKLILRESTSRVSRA